MKPYPKYRDSRIEWIRKLPEEWEVRKLKYVAQLKSGNMITAELIKENGEYPVYGGNGLRGYASSYTHDGSFVLIGRQGALCGNVCYASGQFWASEHAVVASLAPGHNSFWFGELLRIMNLNQYSQSAAQPGLAVDYIKNLFIPMPSKLEQNSIAAYLSRNTARIDKLIINKRRLIGLLKEERLAVIGQAVTKGLDLSVKMRDSGMEWVGNLPNHWNIVEFRRIIKRIEQGWSPVAENRLAGNEEWAVIKLSAIYKGKFREVEHKSLSEETEPVPSLEIKNGNVLLTRANTPDLVGDACIVKDVRYKLMLSDLVYRLNFDSDRAYPEYLVYWLICKPGRAQIEMDAHGTNHSMVKISQEKIKSWRIILPPFPEQIRIVEYLDYKTSQIDQTIERAEKQIQLLQEYRTAIISEVVTGKIDVREEVTA